MPDLGDLGVVETARLTTSGERSAREVTDEALARIDRLDRPVQRLHRGPRRRRPRRGRRARRRVGPGRDAGAAARRTGRHQGGDRRRRVRDDVRRPVEHDPGDRRRRAGAPAARGRGGGRGQDRDAGVRRVPVHRVRGHRLHPQPLGRRALTGWVQRRQRRGGRHRDGPGRDRRRRRRLDPGAVVVLRALRAQAPAGPGLHRPAPAPVVGARRGRPADAQRGRQCPGQRRDPRQPADRPLPGRRRRALRHRRVPRAGPPARGLVARRSLARCPARPRARGRGARHRPAARRARPRRARDRPALPRPLARLRPAVLRGHPHRGRRGRALRPPRAADAADLPDGRLGERPRP